MTKTAEFTILAEWIQEQQRLCENTAKDLSGNLVNLLEREQALGASYCLQSLIKNFTDSIEFKIKKAIETENAN